MNHFLDINQLSATDVDRLIKRALFFKQQGDYPRYPHYTVANLFYENSTRTRVSFELAANHLGMSVVNLSVAQSSENKGEMIEDTVKTLSAMGIQLFVIRHSEDGMPKKLAFACGEQGQVINAGDGQHAHPSQAMLDFMTIVEQKPHFQQLKIAIVGNIRHSRVANSLQMLCGLMGVEDLVLVAPELWQPRMVHYGRVTPSLNEGIENADVIICLRVQHERLNAHDHIDSNLYRRDYALTRERLGAAKANAMVMHPGPINRGMEIDSDVVDGPQSFILQQVQNGVFMRMSILEELVHQKRG